MFKTVLQNLSIPILLNLPFFSGLQGIALVNTTLLNTVLLYILAWHRPLVFWYNPSIPSVSFTTCHSVVTPEWSFTWPLLLSPPPPILVRRLSAFQPVNIHLSTTNEAWWYLCNSWQWHSKLCTKILQEYNSYDIRSILCRNGSRRGIITYYYRWRCVTVHFCWPHQIHVHVPTIKCKLHK